MPRLVLGALTGLAFFARPRVPVTAWEAQSEPDGTAVVEGPRSCLTASFEGKDHMTMIDMRFLRMQE